MKNTFPKLLLSQILLCACISASAQWTDLATFNQVIADLKTYDGSLWVGGNFTKLNGNTCYWSARYNGSSFTPHTTLIGGTGVDEFAIFDGDLYAAGGMNVGFSSGVFNWDGSTWASAGDFNTSFEGIYADGNDLYAGSDFGEVYKKTGSGSFVALPPFGPNDDMSAFAKFNGQIIVGGSFNVVGSTDFNNIAAWNGSAWTTVGDGLDGEVLCMAVYNNELYVGGIFSQAGGQDAEYIAKWNGTSWSAVGGSVTGAGFNGIRDMMVYDNKLYVVGDFTKIGNTTTKYVAYWNGSAWTGLGLNVGSSFPECIEAYNGKIYIGTFDFSASHLYRFDGTVATGEPGLSFQISCSPNPASDIINISVDQTSLENSLLVRITDNAGRTILEDNAFQQSAAYVCSSWEAGVYHVSVLDKKTQRVLTNCPVVKQ